MIRIKFEIEEQEGTPLSIGNENVDFPSDNNNVVVAAEVPKKVVPKKNSKLDNSITDSVAVGSRLFETEPAESLSEFTIFQLLNHPSLNIPGFSIPNCSQFQTIDSEFDQSIQQQQEQSIPNGTEQFVLLPKIERIVSEIHQEVLLSLDQCSLIPDGAQQQQQSVFLPKIEPIVSEIHQEVPLSLDQCFSISNSNSMETNCDITTKMFWGPRAGLSPKAESNVFYLVPMEPNPVSRRSKKEPSSSSLSSADNSESTNNDIGEHYSVSGCSISGPEQQLEQQQKRLKIMERVERHRENENEDKREQRLERANQYNPKRKKQLLSNATPEQREQRRLKTVEAGRRYREKETDDKRQQRLERKRHYNKTVGNQRREQKRQTMTPEEREKKRIIHRERYYRIKNNRKRMAEKIMKNDKTSLGSHSF